MLSTVIPVYNEVDSLDELHRELDAVAREHGYDLDIVFVDDGSNDGSWQKIEEIAGRDPRVRGIQLRRNFGKAAALCAGFEAARGDLVVTLDADLQDDPSELPKFLAAMEKGLDVVSGWKKIRHDPWHKTGPSRVFNWMVGRLTDVRLHDHNCGFKCYRREIFDEVRLYGEMHRFVPVLAASRGWKVGEVVVNHRARQHGHSKYGVWRIVKGFLDLLTVYFLTGFRNRPLHLLGAVGLLFFMAGGTVLAYLTVQWGISRIRFDDVAAHVHLHQRALFYYAIVAFLLGAQFMTAGFLAELFTAHLGRDTVPYSIRGRVGRDPRASVSVHDDAAKNDDGANGPLDTKSNAQDPPAA